MDSLAVPSGGRLLAVDRADRLPEEFREVVLELGHQYVLGYQPKKAGAPGEWRAIKVELLKSGYRVRARQGYRVAAQ